MYATDMVRIVNVHEAKTHFSKLLADIEAGGEVIIARSGRQVAKLVPATAPRPRFDEGEPRLRDLKVDTLIDDHGEDEVAWLGALEPK